MDYENFYKMLGKISASSSLISLLASFMVLKRIKGPIFPFFILIIISVIMEGIGYICVKKGINNLYSFHIFTVIEFSLMTLFYVLFFKPYYKRSYWMIGLIPLFLIAAVIDYRINGPNEMNNFSVSVEAIVLSFIALLAFFFVMRRMIYDKLLDTSFFWINTAVLLYFSGNLLFFISSNYLHANEQANYLAMWTIHSFMNIFYNILISVGFWKAQVA